MSEIEVRDLRKYYGEVRAVDGVSFDVRKSEVFGILGPNGAGKTTTLEIIETLRKPDSGEIYLMGKDLRKEARALKDKIGVQLQDTSLFPRLTVLETLNLFASFYRRTASVLEMLKTVGLDEKKDALVETLSGGQQKRLSIALALINDPEIIFLDEPTTGLDPQARRRVWEIVEKLRVKGKTVVITTHYMEEAEELCDRVAIMDHGKIIASGTPRDLINNYVPESKVFFRLEPPLDDEILLRMPGVKGVERDEGIYALRTDSPQKALMEIFDLATEKGCLLKEVTIKRASLEDVFLRLTGRRIRQ